jgi:hypothetical protein
MAGLEATLVVTGDFSSPIHGKSDEMTFLPDQSRPGATRFRMVGSSAIPSFFVAGHLQP